MLGWRQRRRGQQETLGWDSRPRRSDAAGFEGGGLTRTHTDPSRRGHKWLSRRFRGKPPAAHPAWTSCGCCGGRWSPLGAAGAPRGDGPGCAGYPQRGKGRGAGIVRPSEPGLLRRGCRPDPDSGSAQATCKPRCERQCPPRRGCRLLGPAAPRCLSGGCQGTSPPPSLIFQLAMATERGLARGATGVRASMLPLALSPFTSAGAAAAADSFWPSLHVAQLPVAAFPRGKAQLLPRHGGLGLSPPRGLGTPGPCYTLHFIAHFHWFIPQSMYTGPRAR